MRFGSRKTCASCALILLTAIVCNASVIYDFGIFNSASWAANKQLKFTVAVCSQEQNKVSFLFQNASSANSSITDIYFDSTGLLKSGADILNGSGADFSAGASPATLPGGENLTPAFAKSPFFAADSNPPPPKNGINPGEWLKITFSLNTGKKFDDVVKQLAAGTLRIGIHIQSLPDGSSVSAINKNAPVPIPEPATIAFFTLGSFVFIRKLRG